MRIAGNTVLFMRIKIEINKKGGILIKLKKFMSQTGLSRKTSVWLNDNIFCNDFTTHRSFTDDDVEWVLDHQIERFSKEHNIAKMDETSDPYYIEDNGKVYSYKRGFLEERKPYLNQRNGYYYITLWNDNEHTTYRLDRLVGKYFVPKFSGCDIINHLDGNKTNNHCDNLEWTTISGNTKHAFDMGLAKNDKGENDSQSLPIDVFDADGTFIHHYGGIKEAGREMGITDSTISRLAKTPDRVSRKYKIKIKYA